MPIKRNLVFHSRAQTSTSAIDENIINHPTDSRPEHLEINEEAFPFLPVFEKQSSNTHRFSHHKYTHIYYLFLPNPICKKISVLLVCLLQLPLSAAALQPFIQHLYFTS